MNLKHVYIGMAIMAMGMIVEFIMILGIAAASGQPHLGDYTTVCTQPDVYNNQTGIYQRVDYPCTNLVP